MIVNDRTSKTLNFILNEVGEQIINLDKTRRVHRRNYFISVILMALLSSVTTFLIGVGVMYEAKALAVCALFTSTAITVISAWDGLFRNKESWLGKNETLRQLYALESKLRFLKISDGGSVSVQQLQQLYRRMETIIHSDDERGVNHSIAAPPHREPPLKREASRRRATFPAAAVETQ